MYFIQNSFELNVYLPLQVKLYQDVARVGVGTDPLPDPDLPPDPHPHPPNGQATEHQGLSTSR